MVVVMIFMMTREMILTLCEMQLGSKKKQGVVRLRRVREEPQPIS